ncbi:MAG: 16S rRNA (uracil(1498)-N(3))-methyltransferase [Armatimonadetes bacterium]|nr:16S rRNA (uracil(1498)-N(3))-methyltransferase [Armatimonadota bacterium]
MHRFYVPQNSIAAGRASFSQDQQRQLRNVLRMKPGDRAAIFDGSGREYGVEIELDESGRPAARVLDTSCPDTEPRVSLAIIQSLPRSDKLDLILQKCTELGAAEFIVTTTERSVARIASDKVEAKMERWRAIVREAAEQSGRVRLPSVESVLEYREALDRTLGSGAVLVAWERERDVELFSMLPRLRGETRVTMIVGPEGGLTAGEVEAARESGATPISLGARTLRTETAAIAASAILISALG